MFLPRGLQAHPSPPVAEQQRTTTEATPLLDSGKEQLEPCDSSIKLSSIEQRTAEPGEPCCIVCGRYGEYICDTTDDDVCSLECKSAVLKRLASSACPSISPTVAPPHEHFVASDIPALCSNAGQSVPSRTLSKKKHSEFQVFGESGKRVHKWEPDYSGKTFTPQQADYLREAIEISVEGDDVPLPILEFSNCRFLPKLQENLEAAGYETPTPVQMQVIPAILNGQDILVSAGTGLGKTAAFLLAIVSKSCTIRNENQFVFPGPLAIVLTPTRELCAQVEDQAKVFAKGLPFKTALVVGGDLMPHQVYRIRQGVELIVGTPGRLIDLLTKHDVNLDSVCMLVLDEVDCMLESGFRDQVVQILTALTQPQVMMFSATIPPSIMKFSMTILKKALYISVGKPSLPSHAVRQSIMWVESKHKKKKLFEILRSVNHFKPPVVIFVSSRLGADMLAESIHTVTGIQAAAVHGEKPMQERRKVLQSFLMGELPVVVATGVLGRGLDLLRVSQVMVFDMPFSVQEYIHQIGRASRLGVPGSALVFLNNESKALFKDLLQLFRDSGANIPKELLNSPYSVSSYAVAYKPKKRKAHN